MVEFIERQPEPPDKPQTECLQRFFRQRLGAAVETARRGAERKIRFIRLSETVEPFGVFRKELLQSWLGQVSLDASRAVFPDFGSGIDAARRNMTPGSIGHETDARHCLGKKR